MPQARPPLCRSRFNLLHPCVGPPYRSRRRKIFKLYAGQVESDRRPGRIGFMSRQRRDTRRQLAGSTYREGVRGLLCPVPLTQVPRAASGGPTARPRCSVQLATDSLHKHHRFVPLVRQDIRRGRPPLWTSHRGNSGTPAPHRCSPSLLSVLSGSARLHSSLPQAPAGLSRWAERHDGKGNLHFKHAA